MARMTKAQREAAEAAAAAGTPVVDIENKVLVRDLLAAADDFVGKVTASALDQYRNMVRWTTDMAGKFQPLYLVERAKYRAAHGSDKDLSAAMFATTLTAEGRVLKNDPNYVFPVSQGNFATIIAWVGDQDDHDALEVPFLNYCAKVETSPSFGRYVTWLGKYRDPDGAQYDDEGNLTERGRKLIKDADDAAALVYAKDWCSMDFRLNVEGLPSAGKLAWIDAAIHDLERFRMDLIKAAGSEATKIKRTAKDIRESMVNEGKRVGGDKLSAHLDMLKAAAATA